ncbi:glycosyltransferase family 2 protein [Staphylothermus hellenicus]|uniref:glycosyltransferase family 2 protein n=1 Tax=Staphylothermus hellenicus TaxID=84599 RepID=UPI0011E578CF|nr:glycosyltransferase family 2 protein [Staphylothermus hellenicus]
MGSEDSLRNLTVLIPVLNEAKAIGKVLDEVLNVGVPRENIIVVDGGSSDGTVEIARSRNVEVIPQEGKGKALAIKTGLKHVSTPYVLVMDGDYTYPAKHIIDLYKKIMNEGHDLVIGSRRFHSPVQTRIYRIGNLFLTKLFNLLFGTGLTDILSGMYIAKTEKLREIMFEMPHFSVESEIVAHVASTTGRIAEIPINYRRRLGEKKLSVKHGIGIARDMIRLTWRYNPAFFIFILGSLLLIPGLLLGGWVAYHYFFVGIKYYVKGLVAIILTAAGFTSLLLAVMALYTKRIEMRMQKRMDEIEQLIEEYLNRKS